MKTKLSVNVNKIATLRNSRGGAQPSVIRMSKDALSYGAHGITVHPRPDGRHILPQDVDDLSILISEWNRENADGAEFNVEGYPDDRFLQLMSENSIHQATLVPDSPDVITSNAGWRLESNETFLKSVVNKLKEEKIRVSLFIDVFEWGPGEKKALDSIRPDRVELYTEAYAKSPEKVGTYKSVASEIKEMGIGINAGHDLSTENLALLIQEIPFIDEVSIGHALVADSLYWGWERTITKYLHLLGHKKNA